jgi:flagellar assembly protein FliH
MSSNSVAALGSPAPEPARFTLWPLPDLQKAKAIGASEVDPGPVGPSPEEAAYARGVAEGRAEATREAAQTVKSAVNLLADVADDLSNIRGAYAGSLDEHLLVLATAVAREVLQREVQMDPALVGELVRKALLEVPWDALVEVRVNPEDLNEVSQHINNLNSDARPSAVEWVGDSGMARGSYVIDTPRRLVDGRLETVLESLWERIAND